MLNVWVAWKSDTDEQKRKAIQWDAMTDDFQLELFIRDRRNDDVMKATRGAIMHALEKAFEWINIAQKESQATSNQYPEIDYNNFIQLVRRLEEHCEAKPGAGHTRILRAQVELIFVRATRNDGATSLNGALCRAEFLEALVRLSATCFAADLPDNKKKQTKKDME